MPIWYNIMSITRIKCDVRNLISLIRVDVWNSTSYKAKTYSYKKPMCVCFAICNTYLVCISICILESCVMCICMFPFSKHDTCIYVFVFCFMLCYVDCWSLFYSCLSLLRKTGVSVIVQVRSDAGWVIVRYRNLKMINDLSDLNCLWLLVGWPWPGGETT